MTSGMTHALTQLVEILLWASLGTIVYSYLFYPLLVAVIVRLVGKRATATDDAYLPSVSVVVSLYNEEAVLPERLTNLEAVEYPPEKLEFLLGSDGSTDRTNELLAAWNSPAGRIFCFPRRRGKGPTLNDLMKEATGEIVVFSDANTVFEPGTVRRLVRRLADPSVGAVCGELILKAEENESGGLGEKSYWSYENWLKRMESDFDTLLGATGGVYAIRRTLFVPLPAGKSVTDDFLIPLKIVMQGYRVIYARDAVAFERTSGSMRGEFRRKARIGAQNFSVIREIAPLLSPAAGFTAFALWSHKIIRWCVPFLAMIAFLATASLALASPMYAGMFAMELAFLGLGAVGFAADRWKLDIGSVALPYYILAMNLALLVGFFRFLARRQDATWEVLR
jgi:poly-beta-1,6-N-acetyl-D-glucosamine synthase